MLAVAKSVLSWMVTSACELAGDQLSYDVLSYDVPCRICNCAEINSGLRVMKQKRRLYEKKIKKVL